MMYTLITTTSYSKRQHSRLVSQHFYLAFPSLSHSWSSSLSDSDDTSVTTLEMQSSIKFGEIPVSTLLCYGLCSFNSFYFNSISNHRAAATIDWYKSSSRVINNNLSSHALYFILKSIHWIHKVSYSCVHATSLLCWQLYCKCSSVMWQATWPTDLQSS